MATLLSFGTQQQPFTNEDYGREKYCRPMWFILVYGFCILCVSHYLIYLLSISINPTIHLRPGYTASATQPLFPFIFMLYRYLLIAQIVESIMRNSGHFKELPAFSSISSFAIGYMSAWQMSNLNSLSKALITSPRPTARPRDSTRTRLKF